MIRIFALALVCTLSVLVADARAQEPDVAFIVTSQQAFEADANNKTRSQLLEALETYSGTPTIETVNACIALMAHDVNSGTQSKIRESALAAAVHFEPVKTIIPRQYVEAKYVAATALFNHRQKRDAMLEMAHVEGFSGSLVDENGDWLEWAEDLKWKAAAWGLAMRAYFESVAERYPSDDELEAIVSSYPRPESVDAAETNEEVNALPFCEGELIQRPRMRYPAGKARRGTIGAVILRLEFDQNGQVTNPYVLAAAPIEEFDEKSLRTVVKWRHQPDHPELVGVTCRLNRTNVILPLIFQLE